MGHLGCVHVQETVKQIWADRYGNDSRRGWSGDRGRMRVVVGGGGVVKALEAGGVV